MVVCNNKKKTKERERGMNRWSGTGLFWCTVGLSACGYSMLQLIGYIYLCESLPGCTAICLVHSFITNVPEK